MSDKLNCKNDTLTFIQVVCAICVVMLHTNGAFRVFSMTESYWISSNIIENVCVYAVPLFFMISGITLMDYKDKYSTKEFFMKRINKAVIPYAGWSVIALVYIFIISRGNFDFSFNWFFNNLINGQMMSVYWFFPNLFIVYLSMPLFSSIDKSIKESTLKYLLTIGIICNVLVPFLISIFKVEIGWPYEISTVSSFIMWSVMGYVIYYYPPKGVWRLMIYVASVLGFFMQAYGTYYLSMRDGELNMFFKGYNNLPMIMYAPGVFLFLYSVGTKLMKNDLIKKFIRFLGKYTFEIYLMHFFFVEFFINIVHVDGFSLMWRLGAVIPIILCVIVITIIMRKIPVVKKLVP